MSRQKKWWWRAATLLTTFKQHRNSTPVVSSIVACLGGSTKGSSTIPASPDHQVLLCGLDTLAITAGGVAGPSEWLVQQQSIWLDYQNQYEYNDDYMCIELDGKWWQLYPSGSNPYKFQLRNDEVGFIKVWNVDKWAGGVAGKQHIHIHFYSKYLHQFTLLDTFKEAKRITDYFFDSDTYEINTSRADLHTDITNGDKFLTSQQIENVISKSRVRQHYYEHTELQLTDAEFSSVLTSLDNNKGVSTCIDTSVLNKLMSMYHQQNSFGADSVITKREIETAYFGKKTSSIWGKFYNKTKEVVTKNDDDTPLLWTHNGWNGEDVVVRVEFSMRRDFIKQLDSGSYVPLQSFLISVDKIWQYLTNEWLRMVEFVKQNNTTSSKITDFWSKVVSSFKSVTTNLIRKKTYKGKVTQLWKQGIGCIKQMISVGMNNNTDWSYLHSTITALDSVLLDSIEDGEYYKRRKLLGVA